MNINKGSFEGSIISKNIETKNGHDMEFLFKAPPAGVDGPDVGEGGQTTLQYEFKNYN